MVQKQNKQQPIQQISIPTQSSTSHTQKSHQSSTANPPQFSQYLNPQKSRFQKTSESSLLQNQAQQQDYTRLQQLLQGRQASLREHAKHSYQLKLYIEELEEKNRALQNNNNEVLKQYKTEVVDLKKENDGLRKVVKRFEIESVDIKKQLQNALNKNTDKTTDKTNPFESPLRQQSQSVIKVIESQDSKTFRQNLLNSKLLLNFTGKQSPILNDYPSNYRINSQSREKLKVTMKSLRKDQDKSRTIGRNQKHILSTELFKDNQHERSIKKLVQIKKNNQLIKNKDEEGKLQKILTGKIIRHRRGFSEPRNDSQSQSQADKEKLTCHNLLKECNEQLCGNKSSRFNNCNEKPDSSIRKRKNQHQLIKLGHYCPNNNEKDGQ